MVATKPALVMQSPSKIVPFMAGYSFISMVGEHITPVVGGLVLQNHPKVGALINLVFFMFSIWNTLQEVDLSLESLAEKQLLFSLRG